MKTFIYTTKEKDQKYGVKYIVNMYQLKKNVPEFIGTIDYQSGGYRGHDSEVMRFIVQNKHLPKNCLDKSGYLNYDKRGETFQLFSI